MGLAWTVMGGEILFVEATKMPGSGELILTGQLGEIEYYTWEYGIYICKLFSKKYTGKI